MNSACSRVARALILLGVIAGLVAVPVAAFAQAAAPAQSKPVAGLGYGFVGFGASTGEGDSAATYHLGGGGEAIFADAVGVGAEIGYLNWFEEHSEGIGVFSVNGTFHIGGRKGQAKVRPFVTGGYTLGFRDGHESLFNVGGGVNYWFKRSVGLRIEFRDHIWHEENDTIQFLGVRFGVTFR